MSDRILNASFRSKVMSADEAAALIPSGAAIGSSGFTPAGAPKDVPVALAKRAAAAKEAGEDFKVGIWTGASTGPSVDGAIAGAGAMSFRTPYQGDANCRKGINSGEIDYVDMHLSHAAPFAAAGFLGKLDYAIIEIVGITEDGRLIPSTSVGNNATWIDLADKVILEVTAFQTADLEGMHDIYRPAMPPHRLPIPIVKPSDRIGEAYFRVDPKKVVAVVNTNASDICAPFSPADQTSQTIANNILEFLTHEVKKGRLPANLLPLQSGVGNVANAVMAGLQHGSFEHLNAYTEVLQDGTLDLLLSGKLDCASTTSLTFSPQAQEKFFANSKELKNKIILRPQELSNNPELIRRMGLITMNALIEADIYGNVNSTHIQQGTAMMNGIGGSGDFARNAYISMFMTPSTAKGGAISCIMPMVTHVDHTEHDVHVLVTEQGLADLRGLSPKKRAKLIIENCAHPKFRPALQEYYERALRLSPGKHTPHLLEEVYSFMPKWFAEHGEK
jgi:succinyl-CoA:acetate CoA-transferase